MKNKLNNLEDIRREKQKLLLEIGVQEYALNLNFRQIKEKLTFISFTAYVFDTLRRRLRARIPALLAGLAGSFWKTFTRKKKR